jgi:2-amino-4-hydroxy-6-hydroxymethyldihydropteridine diphosphokinase
VTSAYVGFGANLGDARSTYARVVEALGARRASSLWRSEPVGGVEQPWFLNGCLELPGAPPRELLDRLLAVEARFGRDRRREVRGGPRTCDLDLLLVGDLVVDEPGLTVPHPRLHERAFALAPLVELAGPDLVVPGRGRAGDLLARTRIGPSPALEKIV